MLGEKMWVGLAVPTGNKIWPDVWGQGDPCPGKGEGAGRSRGAAHRRCCGMLNEEGLMCGGTNYMSARGK